MNPIENAIRAIEYMRLRWGLASIKKPGSLKYPGYKKGSLLKKGEHLW
jgi:SLT domain-containing protein